MSREERKLFKHNTLCLNNLEWYNLMKGRNETSNSSIARCRQFAIRTPGHCLGLALGSCNALLVLSCAPLSPAPWRLLPQTEQQHGGCHRRGAGTYGIWLVRELRVSQGCCQVGWVEQNRAPDLCSPHGSTGRFLLSSPHLRSWLGAWHVTIPALVQRSWCW